MNKIEDLAFKEYPVVMTTLIPADNEHPLIEQDCNKFTREAYIKGYKQAEKDLYKSIYKAGVLDGFEDAVEGQYEKGYEQAEKDLELTWEDLATIEKLSDDFIKQNHKPMSNEEFYTEVLKLYKEMKGYDRMEN